MHTLLAQPLGQHLHLDVERGRLLRAQLLAQLVGRGLQVVQQPRQAGRRLGAGLKPFRDALQPVQMDDQEAPRLRQAFRAAAKVVEHPGHGAGRAGELRHVDHPGEAGARLLQRAGRHGRGRRPRLHHRAVIQQPRAEPGTGAEQNGDHRPGRGAEPGDETRRDARQHRRAVGVPCPATAELPDGQQRQPKPERGSDHAARVALRDLDHHVGQQRPGEHRQQQAARAGADAGDAVLHAGAGVAPRILRPLVPGAGHQRQRARKLAIQRVRESTVMPATRRAGAGRCSSSGRRRTGGRFMAPHTSPREVAASRPDRAGSRRVPSAGPMTMRGKLVA
jgi:hypothetical protein